MTKAADSDIAATVSLVPAGEAGAPEIEITSEMVEAGAATLIESGFLQYDRQGAVELLIRNILSACLSLAKPR